MASWKELTEKVRSRASDRCEYCRMHQALQGATFHVEHVVPESMGGLSELDNLALACPNCNLHKSDRVEVPDGSTGGMIRLFDPRRDSWHLHFSWHGTEIVAQSDIGRVTIDALQLNSPRRLLIREAEAAFDMFPPPLE